MGLSRRLQADLAILGLSAIWGCTFVVSKRALTDVSPLLFITFRFTIAAAVLWFLLPAGSLRGAAAWERLRAGAVIGIILFAAFAFQTGGLQYTTPSRSAFITSLYVIFTPLLVLLLGRRRPSIDAIVGAVIATVGLYFLTGPESGGFGRGEMLTLLCAVGFAAHLIAIDHYTRRHDPAVLAFLQIAVVAVLATGPAATVESTRFVPTASLLMAVLVTSFLATALAIHVLNRVQSWTTPTRAAVIFAAEPVFAGVTSRVVEGEILSGAALLGAVLILAGILTTELGPVGRLRAEPTP